MKINSVFLAIIAVGVLYMAFNTFLANHPALLVGHPTLQAFATFVG